LLWLTKRGRRNARLKSRICGMGVSLKCGGLRQWGRLGGGYVGRVQQGLEALIFLPRENAGGGKRGSPLARKESSA